MCACESIIKNKQHGSLKRGNFGGKPKFYGASKQNGKKRIGREAETDKEKRKTFQGTEEILPRFTKKVQSNSWIIWKGLWCLQNCSVQ